jgi:hypothetical protein
MSGEKLKKFIHGHVGRVNNSSKRAKLNLFVLWNRDSSTLTLLGQHDVTSILATRDHPARRKALTASLPEMFASVLMQVGYPINSTQTGAFFVEIEPLCVIRPRPPATIFLPASHAWLSDLQPTAIQ